MTRDPGHLDGPANVAERRQVSIHLPLARAVVTIGWSLLLRFMDDPQRGLLAVGQSGFR